MLITDMRVIGNKLLAIRKRANLTQAEVAEYAELSDRTYADIERGEANMRLSTLLRICGALKITPDEILTDRDRVPPDREELLRQFDRCTPDERETAAQLVDVYLRSLHRR